MARALFQCYAGYNDETRRHMYMMQRHSLEGQAERALAALHDAGFAVVPREAEEKTLRPAVDLALRVKLSADYDWMDYMSDLRATMIAAADIAAPDGEALRRLGG